MTLIENPVQEFGVRVGPARRGQVVHSAGLGALGFENALKMVLDKGSVGYGGTIVKQWLEDGPTGRMRSTGWEEDKYGPVAIAQKLAKDALTALDQAIDVLGKDLPQRDDDLELRATELRTDARSIKGRAEQLGLIAQAIIG